MTPDQAFLLVLFLLYLSDCFILVPRRGFGFLSILGRRRWWVNRPSTALGNDRGGLVFAMPLPPLGRAFVAGLWPISLTAKGFTSLVTSCANPGARPAMPSGLISWADVREIGWDGRTLFVNRKTFLKLPSAEIARHYARLLWQLAKLPEAERADVIRAWCDQQLSAKRVRRRLRVFERATAGLRRSCNVLFLITFIVLPVSYWKFQASLPVFICLGIVGLLMLVIGIEFLCLHRGFYPEQKAERFQLWLLVGFMPQYAMRAVDELSKGFLACTHPLAAAESLLDDTHFNSFRDAVVRDLRSPAPQVLHGAEMREVLELADQFRSDFEAPAVERIIGRRLEVGVQSQPLAAALEVGSAKFCPRCLMPFEAQASDCIDCGGVATLELPGGRHATESRS